MQSTSYKAGFDLLKTWKTIIFAALIGMTFCSLKNVSAAHLQSMNGKYDFVFDSADSLLVHKLIQKMKPSLERLENFFGRETGSVITIFLTPSRAEYRKRTHGALPEWSQAAAFTRQRFIVLRIASAEEIASAPQTLTHELVHIQIAEKTPPGRMPVWLNEGLAQYLSGKRLNLNDKVLLANALALKKIPPLAALDSLLSFGPQKARLAYIQALSAVHYFVKVNGRKQLRALVSSLALHHSINDAFKDVCGFDFIDFEINWYGDLKENYRFLVILNLDNIIWLSMGLLALLAIFVVRRRNRKKVKDWEMCEADAEEIGFQQNKSDSI